MGLWMSKKREKNAAIYVQEIKNWRLNITIARIRKLFEDMKTTVIKTMA